MSKRPLPTARELSATFRRDRLKERREALGLSQMDLGWSVGSSATGISRLERDPAGKDVTANPTADTLARLALVLHVSADYLLNLSDDPVPHGRKKLV